MQSAKDMLKRCCVPVVLLLLSLMPRVGFAARDVSESLAPGSQEPSALRLMEGEEPEPERLPRGVRILAETGASLLTGAVTGALGFLAGEKLCHLGLVDTQSGWFPCLGALSTGLFVGIGLGLPLGVFWGGERAGGDARLLGALGGYGVGVLAAGLVGLVVTHANSDAILLLALPLGLVGAIVGYELTDQGGVTHRVEPLVSVSSRGALLGLRGTF